jgi:hypothetical protein
LNGVRTARKAKAGGSVSISKSCMRLWGSLRKLEKARPDIRAPRSSEELLSPKISLLACVLLVTSLFFAIDHATVIERELKSQFLPKLGSGNVDANRPIGTCVPTGSAPKDHHDSGNCPFSFSLSMSQKNLTQFQGSSSSVLLSVTLVSGVSVPVTLSAQGAPAGTEILFTPASAKPSFSSTVTIATSAETPVGQFNITVVAAGGILERSTTLSLVVVPIVHDITVVSARVQETARIGSIVWINATVANYGSLSEVFEIQAYANTTLVADNSVPKLAAATTMTDRLTWNTTGFSPGTYMVLVTVPPVPSELNVLDNSREAGKMILTQNPGSIPGPSPAASGGGQGSNYGRQLAIVAAIAEVALVFLLVLRRKRRNSTRNTPERPAKI